jgi:oxygen-dependent protoporphyrinogen oxidase
VLLEAGPRLGGILRSELREGFLIEHGAENFITTVPSGIELCERIGFGDQLLPTNETHRRAFVLHRGRLRPIPAGFAIMAPSRIWPVLATPILSPLGKLRLASELFVPRRTDDSDESLASFVTRRLGRETFERLVQPLVAGIYTADPTKLSVAATMPRFREMERQHGSLIRAMWKRSSEAGPKDKQASGARYSQFVAPREGMESLVNAVANRLPSSIFRLNSPVATLRRSSQSEWKLETADSEQSTFEVDGVVLALRARECANLLRNTDGVLANHFERIEYGSCALATFGFRRDQIRHPLDGFGLVVPQIERRRILSASFSSVKYPGRAPEKHVLIRAYLGGACQPELMQLDNEQLLNIALQELGDMLGIDGKPVLTHVNRQTNAMPQYHVGHQSLVKQINDRADQLPGLFLASNSLGGVGVPNCIRAAEVAVERMLAQSAVRIPHFSTSF